MSHTTARDAERTTGTPAPLIVCTRLKALLNGRVRFGESQVRLAESKCW